MGLPYPEGFNSQSAKKADDKMYVCKILKICIPQTIIVYSENSNSVDSDEVAHHEPPHLDLSCLSFLVLQV